MGLSELKEKISAKQLKMGVIGLGYVGLPLAVEFAENDVDVTGFDVSVDKVDRFNNGECYIDDVDATLFKNRVEKGNLSATTDFSQLSDMDLISICVPTPLGKTRDPDMSYVSSALENIKNTLRKGQLIVLESTTYPGTTEEVILPELESTGLKVGEDFFLAFSPERVDPGNERYKTKNTPKILGGITEQCTEAGRIAYELAIDTIVKVSCPKTAEMVKLLENTFRAVNIGMANEMALVCDRLKIDTWEVINAAATKPFGFMPFYPGPGLGGHCIPIDPFYLSWKLKTLDYETRFISLAAEVNKYMPQHVVHRVVQGLNDHSKSVKGSTILVLGVAYKPNIDDVRESPALDIMKMLTDMGANIQYQDNYIPKINIRGQLVAESVDLTSDTIANADCVLIITNHDYFQINEIVDSAKLIIDTRNLTSGIKDEKIIKL